METLSILICSADKTTRGRIAQALSDDFLDLTVETHSPMDIFLSKTQGGDFFLFDLDGLNPYILCSLISRVRYTCPTASIIGLSTLNRATVLGDGFKLDACFNKVPCLEDLRMLAPQMADKNL